MSFCDEMKAPQKMRLRHLQLAFVAILMAMIGTMFLAPVQVGRMIDDPTQIDGTKFVPDYWGQFKVNWIGWTLIWGGIGLCVFALARWIRSGISERTSSQRTEQVDAGKPDPAAS